MSRSTALLLLTLTGCTWDWEQFAELREDLHPQGVPGAWALTFQEECDGAALNTNKWNTLYTGSGKRFPYYDWGGSYAAPDQVSISEGLCRIRVDRRPSGSRQYATGVLDSGGGKFEQLGGYFEVRMRVPRGVGLRSVAQLASSRSWPPLVDMARVSGGEPTRLTQGFTYKGSDGNAATFTAPEVRGADLSQDFHTYGVDWDDTRGIFSFFLDGVKTGEAPMEAGRRITSQLKFEITVHAAIKNGTQPDATTILPAHLEVDWARAWRRR